MCFLAWQVYKLSFDFIFLSSGGICFLFWHKFACLWPIVTEQQNDHLKRKIPPSLLQWLPSPGKNQSSSAGPLGSTQPGPPWTLTSISTALPWGQLISAELASIVFLKHTRDASSPGPMSQLFPLSEVLSPPPVPCLAHLLTSFQS